MNIGLQEFQCPSCHIRNEVEIKQRDEKDSMELERLKEVLDTEKARILHSPFVDYSSISINYIWYLRTQISELEKTEYVQCPICGYTQRFNVPKSLL